MEQNVQLTELVELLNLPTSGALIYVRNENNALDTDKPMYYDIGKIVQLLAAKADTGHRHNNATTTSDGFLSSSDKTKLDGIQSGATNYTHPIYAGDDIDVDTTELTGANVISRVDINVTTDNQGHVVDANATVSTRTLTAADIGAAAAGHAHVIGDITGLQTALNNKADTGHTHTINQVLDLQNQLDGKAPASHGHSINDVTGLQGALDSKADTGHTHTINQVLDLQNQLDSKASASQLNSAINNLNSTLTSQINNGYTLKYTNNNLPTGWYTIATNAGNRASARFAVWDMNSYKHQTVIFYASHHYGTDESNTLTVLDNSYYNGSPIRFIRIKDGGTHDGAALQVYIEDSTNYVNVAIVGDNVQEAGWVLQDWIPDSVSPPLVSNYTWFGERSRVDLDNIAQGGFATTGEIYAGGDTTLYRVFHDNYHPNADRWTSPRTLTIGNTGKTVDGSGNVSWSLSEIGAQPAGSYAAASHTHTLSDITDASTIRQVPTGGTTGQLVGYDASGNPIVVNAPTGGGMTANEKTMFNRLLMRQAEDDYVNSRTALGYKGGAYDIFADAAKIASQTQVTVSTLAGGDAQGKVELADNIVDTWDVTTATFDGSAFSVSAQDTSLYGIAFKPDGTKMYIVGPSGAEVNPYTLSTPWDVTTATFDGTPFIVAGQETSPTGIAFKPDGTKMYIVGLSGDEVNPYTLSTPWDVTTATFDGTPFSVSAQESTPSGIAFKPDGTKMYIVGPSGNDVNPYTLSTAWDVTTATFDGTPFSVAAQDTSPYGIAFKPDGTKMYIVGTTGADVNPYTLSTAWDVTTATFDGTPFSVSAQESIPTGIAFKPDGTKMYIVGPSGDDVIPYTIGTNNGFFTPGNFVTTSIDLTSDLSAPPAKVVVSTEAATPTNTAISVTISDGTNDVVIPSANFDTEVDCSALTTRTLTATWNLSTTDTAVTPTLDNYALYFSE